MGSAVLSALHGPLQLGFAGASHVGWWIIAGCGAAVLLLAIITTGRWAKATAERAASRTAPGSPRVPCPHEGISHTEFAQNWRSSWVPAKVISYPAGSGDVSPASEMGPTVRHGLGATWPGYVSIMVWLGRGRQPGWGGALVFSRQGCPRTDLDGPN